MPVKIKTKPYGELEIPETNIIEFSEGIFAFEKLTRFAIIPAKKGTGFSWLQSLEESALAFLLMKPADIVNNYKPNILIESLSELNLTSLDDADIWGIVTIPQGEPQSMTINLQGPIIINPITQKGAQFVSDYEGHSVRARILELMERGQI